MVVFKHQMLMNQVHVGAGRTMETLPAPTARPSRAAPGALVVGQSGGPTAVINASLVGAGRAAPASNQGGGNYGARYGVRGVPDPDLSALRPGPAQNCDTAERASS